MELGIFYVFHKSFSISLSWGRLIESTLSHYIYLTYIRNLSSQIRLFFQMVPFLSFKFLHHNPLCISFIPILAITLSLTYLISFFLQADCIFFLFYPELERLCTLHILFCRFTH